VADEFENLGTLAEEFHVATRNQAGLKHLVNQHLVHYRPDIQQMEEEAPLRLTGRSRRTSDIMEFFGRRKSSRSFAGGGVSLSQLATLLLLGNAVRPTGKAGYSLSWKRHVPSSGNLGSVEVFPIVLNVRGVQPGIYQFDTVDHDLALLKAGDFQDWLLENVFYQREFAFGSVVLVLCSALGRLARKYGDRGYRLALLDVGHVSQNIYLAGAALGLQVCASGGFIDDELDRALGLDGLDMASMLTLIVGPDSALGPHR
jgi:SagB-type dehydrogenase family enzyme